VNGRKEKEDWLRGYSNQSHVGVDHYGWRGQQDDREENQKKWGGAVGVRGECAGEGVRVRGEGSSASKG